MTYSTEVQADLPVGWWRFNETAANATIPTGFFPGDGFTTTTLDDFETTTGYRPDVVMTYLSFSQTFPATFCATAKSRGQTPMLSWMPDVGGANPSTNANIAAGTWDTYLNTFANAVKAHPGPVWLRLGFEMNGNWFQWADTNFNAMWLHVRARFTALGVTNAVWVWAPNVVTGILSIASVFPGESAVDVCGMDGYNWGNPAPAGHTSAWQTFSQIFDTTISQIRALAPTKPLWVTETASAEAGGDKAAWITDAFEQLRIYNLDGLVWFNMNKETDWRVNSSAGALTAYQNGTPVQVTRADDNVGTNDGDCFGAPTLHFGRIDLSSSSFQGVAVKPATSLNPASVTLEAIVEISSVTGNNRILQKGGTDNQYRLLYESGLLKLDVTGRVTVTGTGPSSGLHHIAGTYDSTTGVGVLYVDGVQLATATGTPGAAPATTDMLYIGQKPSGQTAANGFNGNIYDAAVYPSALSAARVQAHARWMFHEAQGIPYVASAGYDSVSTTVTTFPVVVPPLVAVDDYGLLLVTWVGTALETPPVVTANSGTGNDWTVAAGFSRTDNNMGWAVLSRRVGPTDSGTITVNITGLSRFITAAAAWYLLTQAITVGTVGSRGGVTLATIVAPSMAASTGETIVGLFSERSTTPGTTVAVDVGNVRLYREGTGSATDSVLIVDFLSPGAATGAVTATYSTTSGNGAGILVELTPVSVPTGGDGTTPGYAVGYTLGYGPVTVVQPPDPPTPPIIIPPTVGTPGGPALVRWQWVIGPWRTGPEVSISKARNRSVTWRRDGRSEASFEIDGRSEAISSIAEPTLSYDLWLIRSVVSGLGKVLYRGRIGPNGDRLDASKHDTRVETADYRAVLDRRWLWEGGQLSWVNSDQAAIAWGLVQHTQLQSNGGLGIVRGVGQSTSVFRARNDFPAGKPVGEALDQLGAVENGFDWDITPHVNPRTPTLFLDVFYPGRGTDRSQVLDFGGRIVAADRQADPGQYANAIRGTGADSSGGGAVPLVAVRREAADILTRVEGRWDGAMSESDLEVQQTIAERTGRALIDAQVITPAWSVTFRVNGWGGPEDVWLGDPVLLVVKSGRLDVVEPLQVQELKCTWDDEDNVTTVAELGAITRPGKRWSLRKIDQRLRSLERR